MTDYSVNIPKARAARHGRAEYRIYFGLILLAALPFGVVGWMVSPLTKKSRHSGNPVQRAVAEARAITPMIFQA